MAKKEEIDKIERELKLAREIIFFSFQGKYIPWKRQNSVK